MIKTRNLFYSKQERLYAIWRILRLLLISIPLLIILNKVFLLLKLKFDFSPVAKLIFIVLIILVTTFLDKEKIEELGIELKVRSIVLFVCGIIWAYFCCAQIMIIGALTSNSGLQLVNPFSRDVLVSLAYFLFIIGLSEELFFRGYLISNFGRDTNLAVGLIISAILFSLIHFNSEATWSGILLMGFVFTLLFGLTFIMTKNIFLAIGFHGAWDTFNHLFHQIFISGNTEGSYTKLIVILINVFAFYLIFNRVLKFDIKEIIKHKP
jgi:membrane protease YdiL (CAAX protease family)